MQRRALFTAQPQMVITPLRLELTAEKQLTRAVQAYRVDPELSLPRHFAELVAEQKGRAFAEMGRAGELGGEEGLRAPHARRDQGRAGVGCHVADHARLRSAALWSLRTSQLLADRCLKKTRDATGARYRRRKSFRTQRRGLGSWREMPA